MAPPDERNYSPGPLRRGEPAPDAAIEYDDEDPDSSEQLPYMHLDDFAVLREGGDRGRNKMASVEEIDKEDTATGAYRPLYATGRRARAWARVWVNGSARRRGWAKA